VIDANNPSKVRTMIIAIETNKGILTVAEALLILANGNSLNRGLSQVVLGIYADGRKTSLKGRNDGFYFMNGNYCSEAK
jgi:hypothetical protein